MNFRSDNVTGASPEILAALAAANSGAVDSYGDDALTARVERRLQEIFETDCAVFPVATGTAANALALSCLVPPYGAIYCHDLSHVHVDECGGPEFFTGGAKLIDLPGPDGKLTVAAMQAHPLTEAKGGVHQAQIGAITLTQATECGTVYSLAELKAIADFSDRHGLALHMDGARFANALVALGCSPAEMTWKAGFRALSFGATKNGALGAEAVILFDKSLAQEFAFRRKRAGHLFSKMRFLSAQLEAYLADDLWLKNARHANAMAQRLTEGLKTLPGAALAYPVMANEIFVTLPEATIQRLEAAGFIFYRWDNARLVRLVTAWNTDPKAVEAFLACAGRNAPTG